jgi:ornithine cyclodeaminase
MLTLNAAQTAALLPYPELATEIGRVLALAAAGGVHALERGTLPLPGGGTFLSMAAADAGAAIVKVGSVHPLNTERGLPTVQAALVIVDAVDGSLRAVLDGTTVTTRRTAALSLLAAQRLGASARTTVVIGAGVQARGHVEALAGGLEMERLLVYARRKRPAEQLAAAARKSGVEAGVIDLAPGALVRAIGDADLIITATNSVSPVIPATVAEALRPGATVLAVGAFRPDMAEVAPEVVARCNVVADTLHGALSEAGDLIQAAERGAWSWDGATELVSALGGFERQGKPVLFKSVGHSMFDLAAARLALRLM